MSQFSTFVVVFKAHLTLDNCSYFLTGKCFGKLNFNVKDSLIKGAVFAEPGAVELILRDLQSCVSIVFFHTTSVVYTGFKYLQDRWIYCSKNNMTFDLSKNLWGQPPIEWRYDYGRTIYCFENNRTYAHKMKTIDRIVVYTFYWRLDFNLDFGERQFFWNHANHTNS